jgi:hypothetical protein
MSRLPLNVSWTSQPGIVPVLALPVNEAYLPVIAVVRTIVGNGMSTYTFLDQSLLVAHLDRRRRSSRPLLRGQCRAAYARKLYSLFW